LKMEDWRDWPRAWASGV